MENGLDHKDFFLHPVEESHRRYEAMRSVFVEEQTMKEVADRFKVCYGTVRNWVSEFRRTRDARQSPPFLPHHRADVRRLTKTIRKKMTRASKLQMFKHCHWRQAVD